MEQSIRHMEVMILNLQRFMTYLTRMSLVQSATLHCVQSHHDPWESDLHRFIMDKRVLWLPNVRKGKFPS